MNRSRFAAVASGLSGGVAHEPGGVGLSGVVCRIDSGATARGAAVAPGAPAVITAIATAAVVASATRALVFMIPPQLGPRCRVMGAILAITRIFTRALIRRLTAISHHFA